MDESTVDFGGPRNSANSEDEASHFTGYSTEYFEIDNNSASRIQKRNDVVEFMVIRDYSYFPESAIQFLYKKPDLKVIFQHGSFLKSLSPVEKDNFFTKLSEIVYKINKEIAWVDSVTWESVLDNILAFLTASLSRLFLPSYRDARMYSVKEYIELMNSSFFHAYGLKMLHPHQSSLRYIPIVPLMPEKQTTNI